VTLELSIPDALAQAAHRAASDRGMSSSELFARAVAAFLRNAEHGGSTERSPDRLRDPVWTQDLVP
jgi:hypothetical protein